MTCDRELREAAPRAVALWLRQDEFEARMQEESPKRVNPRRLTRASASLEGLLTARKRP